MVGLVRLRELGRSEGGGRQEVRGYVYSYVYVYKFRECLLV